MALEKKGKRKIVVCGATGNQGGSVVRALLAENKWNVVALTRDPGSDKATLLSELGAEICRADLLDQASLEAAFDGAYGVFGVTQPWTPDYRKCYPEKELVQGMNIIRAAKNAKVKHLVMSSVINYDNQPKGIGPYDGKLKIEAYLKTQGMRFTIVRCAQFMDNIGSHFFPVKDGLVKGFVSADVKVPYVSCKNIGTFNAGIFSDPDWFYCSTVNLVGDFISGNELAQMLSDISGRSFNYKAAPALLLRLFAREFFQMRKMYEKIGRAPYTSEVTDIINRAAILLDNPTTVKDFLRNSGFGTE